MTWSRPADLKAQLARRWERGDLLRAALMPDTLEFPLRLTLKGPSSAELSDRFDDARRWAAELLATPALRVQTRDIQHRVLGRQSLPDSAWVDTLDDALRWLGKQRDAATLAAMAVSTGQQHPELLPWLCKRPLQALDLAPVWPKLLALVAWLRAHPRPGVYLRHVDLPGVHSKFIEAHRAVLGELLDLVLPPDAINPQQTGVSQFAARYGFRDKPQHIRLRLLDPQMGLLDLLSGPASNTRSTSLNTQPPPALPGADLALDAASFSQLTPAIDRVFITENLSNFLAFPPYPRAIVLFGAGYGWDALSQAQWLHQRPIHYWGDLDTHGFAILDQLRAHFPHVQSMLMDRQTLIAHQDFWGREDRPTRHDLPRLHGDERAVYDDLRDNRHGEHVRLEQEFIGFQWLIDRLPRPG